MKPMVDELQVQLTSHLQGVGDNLVRCALSHCNSVLSNATASEQLRKSIEARSLFPVSVVQNAVMENASLTLVDKVNELSAAMCRQVCDSVLVVQSLTNIYKTLVSFSTFKSSSECVISYFYLFQVGDAGGFSIDEKKRSSTPDVLKSRIRGPGTELNPCQDGEEDSEEALQHTSDHSPVVGGTFNIKSFNDLCSFCIAN